jgi:hypothetical protein
MILSEKNNNMKQLTEDQISRYKKLARKKTSVENCGDEWNVRDISSGDLDEAYAVGLHDSDIENARVILDVLGVEY